MLFNNIILDEKVYNSKNKNKIELKHTQLRIEENINKNILKIK